MYLCNVHMRNNEALRSEHDHIRRENKERSRTLIAVQAPLICLKFCRSTRFIVMVRSTRENPFGTAFADPDYFPAASRRFLNLSTRPPASTNFCLPVKKGWHFEQISTLISPPFGLVERVRTVSPHAHRIVTSSYLGWIPSFTFNTSLYIKCCLLPQLRYIISHQIGFCNTF